MAAAKAAATGRSVRRWRGRGPAKARAASSAPTSTTKFRSDNRSPFLPAVAGRGTAEGEWVRHIWTAGLALLAPALLACSAGQASKGFIDPRLTSAYIPLSQSYDVI